LTGLPDSLDAIDAVFTSLKNFFPGRVETSCDLVSTLKYAANPKLNVVKFEKELARQEATEAALELEDAILRSVADCKEFHTTHRYSLFEIYSDFADLIK
jgi:hypothetical protein